MQKINLKKTTKEQMLKMLEEAAEKQEAAEAEAAAHFKDGVKLAEENEKLRGEIGTLTEKLDQMNGEANNKANEIANLKADADALRNKLADTEAALGKANAEVSRLTHELSAMKNAGVQYASAFKYAVEHPFGNLWKWVERKLWWAE